MADRKIIHMDLDAFFCGGGRVAPAGAAREGFRGRRAAAERGVVSSCSYAARQCGVHSAMPTGQALGLCPGLLVIAPDHAAYHEYSEQVMAILRQRTGLVEQLSIDEAFLDVSDLPSLLKRLPARCRPRSTSGWICPARWGGGE